MDKNLAFLGIAKKAGLLAEGTELTVAAARSGKCSAILSASDASESSKRRAKRLAGEAGVRHAALRCTKRELGAALGRGETGVIAIMNAGIAAKFASYLPPDSVTEPPEATGPRGKGGAISCERRRAQ
ncbi:MAG: hypothetical protein LBS51_05300 [Oscillospiraceae bacterium]|jgi:ribosomal protein L7Ae-like RNA K-turn-binding protein|nr:hypothetical protein [Oscillospiraceae bacterium]